ncbi:hypothetical protein [uncultured Winogradskyella sp.]|uniref:hypothetical protein n=1 Tax=uncultured Winogradskyella sp. TaxID=395353 RepID=UPI00263268D8|nr:hypothetical protein [uncultured Winogradskyella sp.]
MIKGYCFLVLLLTTIFSYGQEITFHENTSYAARKLNLVQKLNKSGDSLILESGRKPIQQVDILNDDYLETIEVDTIKVKVDLKKLAIGNYVIQAKVGRDWIVMYMEKKLDINEILNDTETKDSHDSEKVIITDENVSKPDQNSDKYLLKENKMYWVVYENNSQFSSGKTMGLKYIDEIQDLISKIELELKTKYGRYNKLKVYEVYDKSKFMQKQLKNRKYYKSKKSKFFNVSPIYNSKDLATYESKSE